MTETDPFSRPTTTVTGDAEDPNVRRDRYGRYLLPHPETGKDTPWTRATTFAKSISDTFTLSQWSQRMVGIGVATNPDLIATFASITPNDRERGNSAAEDAKNRAGAKTGANLGTALHSFTEQVDRGQTPKIPAPWNRDVQAYTALLDQEGLEVLPDMIERRVLNMRFGIAGTFDRIVRTTRDLDVRLGREVITIPAGTNLTFDLKTGRDLEYGWMEIAIQLSIYACEGEPLIFCPDTDDYETIDVHPDLGLVLHLPVGKAKATLHVVDLATGRQLSDLCARVRVARKVKGLSAPVAVAEVGTDDVTAQNGAIRVSSERVEVREPKEIEEIASARTISDLQAIRNRAMIAKTWTPTVERKALERRSAILADTAGG